MPYKDPEKAREHGRQYYQKNKERCLQKSKKYAKENKEKIKKIAAKYYQKNKEKYYKLCKEFRQKRREKFRALKQTLYCIKCGENRWWVLEFHHRNPNEKEKTITKASWQWGEKRFSEEIAKCDVLCANCHRDLHFQMDNNNVTKPTHV